MPVIDSTERSKFRALVIGGYLEDIEISGSGHNAWIKQTPGGSGFNVANCLSLIGADVLFLSCFGVGDSRKWPFKSIPVTSNCSHGTFLFRGSEVIAVEKPSIVSINEELLELLSGERFDLLYSTLEIGQFAASKAASTHSRIKIIDPSPFHEFKGLEGLEKYDFILANDYMSFDKDDRRVITKASSKGARYGKKEYLPPRIGKSRFGSGDLFGAIFSLLVSTGASPEEAIEEAVKISGEYCYKGKSIGQFLLNIRNSLDYVIRS